MLWLVLALIAHTLAVGVEGLTSPTPNPPTRTIVDILSDNPQYSTTLRLLQHHGLVPTLNQAFNLTLLAPVNSAYVDTEFVTRAQLLYMLVNDTLILENDELLVAPTCWAPEGVPAQIELRDFSVNHGESSIIERNLVGSPSRGVVQGIDRLVRVPETLCQETLMREDTSIWAQITSLGNACSNLGSNLTMFIPSNHALGRFAPIELSYLFGGYATEDRKKLLERHTAQGIVGSGPFEMLDGSIWTAQGATLNGTFEPLQAWVPASNGVYHIYDTLLGDVEFTPEKYILALRGFAFARALRLYGHQDLIDGTTDDPQTLLVPVVGVRGKGERDAELDLDSLEHALAPGLASPSPLANDDDILYQVLKAPLDLNRTDALLETLMPLKSGRYSQKAHYFRSESGKRYINWQPITSEMFRLRNTSLVTMDGKLTPPARLQMAVGPLLLGSYSLTYLDTLGLLDLPTDDSWTVLLPTRDAWEDQILLKYYFDSHPDALRSLFNNFIFRTPFYTTSANQTVQTIDGYALDVKLLESPSFQTGLAFQLDDVVVKTEVTDVLFDNGVVHCVSNLRLRDDFEISALDLISSGHRSYFAELLWQADLGHVLTGNYTVIVPDPEALRKANYTLETPRNELEAMLKLHIIDQNPIDSLKNGEVLDSLAGEPTLMQQISDDIYSISLLYGRGQRVFINGWGNTNGRKSAGSTVLFIDTLISPGWLQQPILRPPFRLRTHTLLLIGIVLGVISCALVAVAAVFIFYDDKMLQLGPQVGPQSAGTGGSGAPQEVYTDEPDNDLEPDEYGRRRSAPVRTPGVSQGREYGQHLDLP